jgi:hypothetical protein
MAAVSRCARGRDGWLAAWRSRRFTQPSRPLGGGTSAGCAGPGFAGSYAEASRASLPSRKIPILPWEMASKIGG